MFLRFLLKSIFNRSYFIYILFSFIVMVLSLVCFWVVMFVMKGFRECIYNDMILNNSFYGAVVKRADGGSFYINNKEQTILMKKLKAITKSKFIKLEPVLKHQLILKVDNFIDIFDFILVYSKKNSYLCKTMGVDLTEGGVYLRYKQDFDQVFINDSVYLLNPYDVDIEEFGDFYKFKVLGFINAQYFDGLGFVGDFKDIVGYSKIENNKILASQLLVFFDSPLNLDFKVKKLGIKNLNFYTLKYLNSELFRALALENYAMMFLLFLMVLISFFGLLMTLIIINKKERKTVFILYSLGCKLNSIRLFYLLRFSLIFILSLLTAVVLLFAVKLTILDILFDYPFSFDWFYFILPVVVLKLGFMFIYFKFFYNIKISRV